jgi:5-methyltetrahydrofolate--homocysteine methyltransferase
MLKKKEILFDVGLEEIWGDMQVHNLYGRHLGLKGNYEVLLAKKDAKAIKLGKFVNELKAEIIKENILRGKGVARFFKAKSEGNSLVVLDQKYTFPRLEKNNLCLVDFVDDEVCFFVVTCGMGVKEKCAELISKGEYLKAHAVAAMALVAVEGMAEYVHEKIRELWGIGTKDGIRVSFGYPVCPNLNDQKKLFALLRPEAKIGVSLTEGFMMKPEASISAMVIKNDKAKGILE